MTLMPDLQPRLPCAVDPSVGLQNGTRLMLLECSPYLLKARTIPRDPEEPGVEVFIPRILFDLKVWWVAADVIRMSL